MTTPATTPPNRPTREDDGYLEMRLARIFHGWQFRVPRPDRVPVADITLMALREEPNGE